MWGEWSAQLVPDPSAFHTVMNQQKILKALVGLFYAVPDAFPDGGCHVRRESRDEGAD
jgi:hypothetical protein